MAYSQTQLGVVPAVIIQGAAAVVSALEKLFGGNGSYDATHAAILGWVRIILADPVGAKSGNYLMGDGRWNESAANAYLALRCWAGDQSILPIYRRVSGDPASNGCGCETAHGCRTDAQEALRRVDAQLNLIDPVVSSAPIPSDPNSHATTPNSGTIYTTLPGGIQVGLPVPGSTIANATIAGVPVWALLAGAALLAFAGGSRRGN